VLKLVVTENGTMSVDSRPAVGGAPLLKFVVTENGTMSVDSWFVDGRAGTPEETAEGIPERTP